MACIEKMSIRGIRSFSPDRDETIEFYSPLTMIVGANGCGKTTIIEALKFICTGALPPNSNKGHSFVNDPTVTDSTEVKANIKLRFLNLAGYPSVVTRSLQVIKKKTKLEFKSVDGVIKTTNAKNEKVSSTQKCSDLDRMIPEMLAVSSPILENVIFCHQEDSNWPMQEGLALKKKFDDVFESTRYTKALEAIAKSKKEYADQVKDLKGELLELGAQLEAAKETKNEIAICEENAQTCQQDLEVNQDRIDRLEEKIRKSRDIIKDAQIMETAIKEMQIRVQESKRRIDDKTNSLEIVYDNETTTTNALENKIITFDESLTQRSNEIAILQQTMNQYQSDIKELRNKGNELNILKGQAESTKQLFENEYKKFKDESILAVNQCGLNPTLVSPTWNLNTSKNLLQAIESKKKLIQKEGEVSLIETNQKVMKLDHQLTEIQSIQQKIEIELNTKVFEQNKVYNEIQLKRNEINSLSSAKSNLTQIEGYYHTAKKTHDDMNDTYATKTAEFKRLIKETGDQMRDLTDEISTLSNQQLELSAFRNELASLAATERHLTQEAAQLNNELETAVSSHQEALILLAKQQQQQQQQSEGVGNLGAGVLLPAPLVAALLSSSSFSSSSMVPSSYSSYSSALVSTPSSALAPLQILSHLKSPTELSTLVSALSQYSSDESRGLVMEREKYQDIKSQRSGLEAVLKQVNDRLQIAQDKLATLTLEENQGVLNCITDLNQLRKDYALDTSDIEWNQPISAYIDDHNNVVMNTTELITIINDTLEIAGGLNSTEQFTNSLKKAIAKLEKDAKMNPTDTSGSSGVREGNVGNMNCCAFCERSVSENTVLTLLYEANKQKLFHKFAKKVTKNKEEYTKGIEKCKEVLLRAQNLKHITQLIMDTQDDINQLLLQKNDQINPRLQQLITMDQNMGENLKFRETQVVIVESAHHCFIDLGSRWIGLNHRQNEVNDKRKRSNQNANMFMSGDGSAASEGGFNNTRSLEDIEELQRSLNERRNDCQSRREKLMNEESNFTKRFYNSKNNFNDQEREYHVAVNQVKKLTDTEENVKILSHQSEQLSLDLRSLQHQKDDISRQFETCANQLKIARLQHQDIEKVLTQRITDILNVISLIQRLMNNIQELDNKYSQYNIHSLELQSQQLSIDIQQIENQINSLTPQLNQLTTELNTQEYTKKQITMNIELRLLIITHSSMETELRELEFKLNGDTDASRRLRDAQRDFQRSEQEKTRLSTERDKLLGKIETYTQQASELQNKLEGRAYRGVEERFRKKTIDYEVTVMTVTDLACYYDALDSALQNFHTLKVREINKIIRELWQLIYKGQDIDIIEIESGQDNEGGGTATVKKRSYNYRVVMRKGDVPLDMRGRCSAGQKVLAAIVIRLALAETFCLSCGVLALDEPTTNLDEANKAGLAHALARIIIDRSSAAQSNFQLICITHDEDFVRLMNTELSGTSSISVPEYYFRVSREELNNSGKFFSRIDRVRWEDM